jgi:hypothetical protein
VWSGAFARSGSAAAAIAAAAKAKKPSAEPASAAEDASDRAPTEDAAAAAATNGDATGGAAASMSDRVLSSSSSSSSSRVLSAARRQARIEQTLARVSVAPLVARFWGGIVRELDDLVRDLRVAAASQPPASDAGSSAGGGGGAITLVAMDSDIAASDIVVAEIARAFGGSAALIDDSAAAAATATAAAGDASTAAARLLDLVFSFVACGLEERVRERVRAMAADSAGSAASVFERLFLRKDDGGQRFFGTKPALVDAYNQAHAAGLLLLPCLAVFRGRWYPPEIAVAASATATATTTTSTTDSADGDAALSSEEGESARVAEAVTTQIERLKESFAVNYRVDSAAAATLVAGSSPAPSASAAESSAAAVSGSPAATASAAAAAAAAASSASGASAAGGLLVRSQLQRTFVRSVDYPSLAAAAPVDVDLEATFGGGGGNRSIGGGGAGGDSIAAAVAAEAEAALIARHDFEATFVLLGRDTFRHAYDMFQQSSGFAWAFQERQFDSQSHNSGPLWVYAVLALFVARELFYILRDPVLLVLTIIIVYAFCLDFIQAQWERFIASAPPSVAGPAQAAVMTVMALFANVRQRVDGLVGGKQKRS